MGGINDIQNLILPVQPVSEIQKTGKEQRGVTPGLFEKLLHEAQIAQEKSLEAQRSSEEEKERQVDITNQQMSLQYSTFLMSQLLSKADKKKDEKK